MNKNLYIVMLISGLVSCTKIEPDIIQIQSVAETADKILLSHYPYENWVGVSDNGTIWVWGNTDIFSLKDGKIKRFPGNGMYNYTYPSMGLLGNKVYYDSGNGLLSVIENDSTVYYLNPDYNYNDVNYHDHSNFLPLEQGMLMSHYEPYDEYNNYGSYSFYFDGAQWKKPNISADLSRYGFAYGSYIKSPVVVFNEATFTRKSFTVSLGTSTDLYNFHSQSMSKTGKLYFLDYNIVDSKYKLLLVELDALTGNINNTAIEIPDYTLSQVYSVNVDSEDNVYILAYVSNNQGLGLTTVLYNYTTNNVVFKNNTLTDGYDKRYQCFIQKNGTIWLISNIYGSVTLSQLSNNELIHSRQFVGTQIGVLKEDDEGTLWFGTWPTDYSSGLFCIDLISFKNGNYTSYWSYFVNPQGFQFAYE